MSNDEFETWLSLVGRLLGLSERQRQQIGEELRDHLESRVADLLESGMDKQSAVMQAKVSATPASDTTRPHILSGQNQEPSRNAEKVRSALVRRQQQQTQKSFKKDLSIHRPESPPEKESR